MSIKNIIPSVVKARVKELLGIGRLEREIPTWSAMQQSAEARLKHLEDCIASTEVAALGRTQYEDGLKQLEDRIASIEVEAQGRKQYEDGLKQLEDRIASICIEPPGTGIVGLRG